MIILYLLLLAITFYGGMLLGVHNCKVVYKIPKGISPEEYIESQTVIEVVEDGSNDTGVFDN